jgi:aryl-alcohol dehydrogenase-like predicted oxidoreductase
LINWCRAGKVREIGCSNFSVAQIREAADEAKGSEHFVSVQNEFSLFHRDAENDGVLAECEARGLAFLPYFPLASGLITGKYRRGKKLPEGSRAAEGWGPKVFTEKNLAVVERLIEFAESCNHTVLDLAFAWLLAHKPVASVIAGASRPEQVRANAKAASWTLTSDDLAAIDAIDQKVERETVFGGRISATPRGKASRRTSPPPCVVRFRDERTLNHSATNCDCAPQALGNTL